MAVEFVDVSDIHLRDIQFHVTRTDGRVFDFSEAVTEFNWADHVNTAGAEANIQCVGEVSEILKIGGEGSSCVITAPLVDLTSGQLVRRELWQGTFEDLVDVRSEGQIERIITGYDICKYFANNEEDLVFVNKTLSQIVREICTQFGVPIGTIAVTTELLGNVIARGFTLWDTIQEAVQRHADLTGEVFYVYAEEGFIHMRLQGDQTTYWVFEAGESVQDVRRVRSVADVINQVKIFGVFEGDTEKPAVEAIKLNANSQGKYGLRQRVEYLGSAEDASKVIDIAQKVLDRFAAPDETVEITGWLVPNLRAGHRVRFRDDGFRLNRLYYVESIETTWAVHRAETVALLRRDPVDPELILEEVTVA